jgi:hypothetical protein
VRVKAIAQRFSMVKLPCAESGDKRNIIMWIAGQEITRRGRILEK